MLIGPAGIGVFSEATGFQAFSHNDLEETTSDDWLCILSELTIDPKNPGKYVVQWSAELGQSDQFKQVGFRVRWRAENGTWAELVNLPLGVPKSGQFIPVSGFRKITLLTTAKIEVEICYGQTIDGGTGKIQNANIYLFRVENVD